MIRAAIGNDASGSTIRERLFHLRNLPLPYVAKSLQRSLEFACDEDRILIEFTTEAVRRADVARAALISGRLLGRRHACGTESQQPFRITRDGCESGHVDGYNLIGIDDHARGIVSRL